MFKTTSFAMGLLIIANASANCLQDTYEIGDIGPESQLICDTLDSVFPGKQIEITNREINSPQEVTILLSIDGQPGEVKYRLTGADWELSPPRFATNF